MKFVEADRSKVAYRKTKLNRLLDEFIASGHECVMVVYEDGEYSSAYSAANALSSAVKRFGYEGTVGVKTVGGVVYMYREDV